MYDTQTTTPDSNIMTVKGSDDITPPPYDDRDTTSQVSAGLYPVLSIECGKLQVADNEPSTPRWEETNTRAQESKKKLSKGDELTSEELQKRRLQDDREVVRWEQQAQRQGERSDYRTGKKDCKLEGQDSSAVTMVGQAQMEGGPGGAGAQMVDFKLTAGGVWEGSDESENEGGDDDNQFTPSTSAERRRVRRKKQKQMRNTNDNQLDNSNKIQTRSQTGSNTPRMMPLVQTNNGVQYRPWPMQDVEGAAAKLPPLSEGGNLWISKLLAVTGGVVLAVGDVRALGARSTTPGAWDEIERRAWLTPLAHGTPMTDWWGPLGNVLREIYPLRNRAPIRVFPWEESEEPVTYLEKAKQHWVNQTGENPDRPCPGQAFFRDAILKGLPAEVETAMKNNPDLVEAAAGQWDRHLLHHMNKTRSDKVGGNKEQAELTCQLLKLQLAEAREKVASRKQDKKGAGGVTSQMVMSQIPIMAQDQHRQVYTPPGNNPDLFPPPPWQPPHRGRGGPMRGGRNFRGRRGGGAPPGEGGNCFLCGAPGHWVRNCPYRSQPQTTRGRGYGMIQRGGPRPRQVQQGFQMLLEENPYDEHQ